MNEDNYAVFSGIEAPELFKLNPEIVLLKLELISDNFETKSEDGIMNPFESSGYQFQTFNFLDFKPQDIKPTIKHASFNSQTDYINTMYSYLYEALENNGIDGSKWAPILVAQTAHESGWGNEFSRRNNNFAGIKGKGSGLVKTKEWSPTKGWYTVNDSFKSYPSIEAFADDYVKKLKNRFKAFEGSPSEFTSNIRKHGYFTAPLHTYLTAINSILNKVKLVLS